MELLASIYWAGRVRALGQVPASHVFCQSTGSIVGYLLQHIEVPVREDP